MKTNLMLEKIFNGNKKYSKDLKMHKILFFFSDVIISVTFHTFRRHKYFLN